MPSELSFLDEWKAEMRQVGRSLRPVAVAVAIIAVMVVITIAMVWIGEAFGPWTVTVSYLALVGMVGLGGTALQVHFRRQRRARRG